MSACHKIDKGTVFTAFFCAIAAFICGFVFCLALLSGNESCYFLVQNFWVSTRAYKIIQYISQQSGDTLFNYSIVGVIGLLCLIIIWQGFKKLFSKECNENVSQDDHFEENEEELEVAEEESSETDIENLYENWSSLNSVQPEVLASYLQNEYPQISAIAISQLSAEQGAAVLSRMNSSFAAVTITQMITAHPLDSQIIARLGKAIAKDILHGAKNNGLLQVSSIWNLLDDDTAEQIMSFLIGYAPDVAELIAKRPIVFEDLCRLPISQIQEIISKTEEAKLVIALLGASDNVRERFYQAMDDRQSKIVREALQRLDSVNLNEIQKAQKNIVLQSKKIFSAKNMDAPNNLF